MMTYDPKLDVFLPFGGLRTAALGKVNLIDTTMEKWERHFDFVKPRKLLIRYKFGSVQSSSML